MRYWSCQPSHSSLYWKQQRAQAQWTLAQKPQTKRFCGAQIPKLGPYHESSLTERCRAAQPSLGNGLATGQDSHLTQPTPAPCFLGQRQTRRWNFSPKAGGQADG